MKTLILLLTASLAAPAFAQSNYETETTNTTTNSSSVTTPGSQAPVPNNATTMDESTSGAITDRAGSSSSDLSGSSSTDSTMASPNATSPNMASPGMTAPATMAPSATTSETTTSRTYREGGERSDRIFGGFYIEPGIVGTREDADIRSGLISGDTTGTANSVAFDLKLGGHVSDMFFLGLDGRYARSRFEETSYQNTDATSWNWGPTLGVNAPYFGGRVWGTYIVEGNYDPDPGANRVDLRFRDPYGWRGGVGIRLSSVSLNLEYEDLTYRTTDFQSVGTLAAASTTTDFAQRGYALSLSFPIDL